MNSFFASVEQAANPSLRGKPIVVCGEGRTVVTTASYEARAYGVKTGMNLYEARRACPQVICVRGTMEKYTDASARMHGILLEFTDLVEVYSIDECFMDVTCLCAKGREAKAVARDIKKRIREELGLLCSIGIGPNKLIAKLASKMQKPDGLVDIRREEIAGIFKTMPVEKLQGVGVGRKLAPKFRSLGIHTAADLGRASLDMLTAHFGIMGRHFREMGNGEDDSPVKSYGEDGTAKSVGHSHTLPRDTSDLDIVRSYLRVLSEKVGTRLREAGLKGRTVHMGLRYGDFTGNGRQSTLRDHIWSGGDIYLAAQKILESMLPLARPVRLVAVSIHNLVPREGQRYLFEDDEKRERLVDTLDEINKKYGEFTVRPSSLLIAENFGLRDGCGMVPKNRYKR